MQGPTTVGTLAAMGPVKPFEWVQPVASQNTNSAVELNPANPGTDTYEMYGMQETQNTLSEI